jgi:phage baseplate assembly protein W
MGKTQKYGIKYPFSSDNSDNIYLDVNDTFADSIKSQLLHLIFTEKGQRIRDPEFGTGLIHFIFQPNDGETLNSVKNEIITQVNKYIPGLIFDEIKVYKQDDELSEIVVSITYSVKRGNKLDTTTVAVKL